MESNSRLLLIITSFVTEVVLFKKEDKMAGHMACMGKK
jgi:hypothetical protein